MSRERQHGEQHEHRLEHAVSIEHRRHGVEEETEDRGDVGEQAWSPGVSAPPAKPLPHHHDHHEHADGQRREQGRRAPDAEDEAGEGEDEDRRVHEEAAARTGQDTQEAFERWREAEEGPGRRGRASARAGEGAAAPDVVERERGHGWEREREHARRQTRTAIDHPGEDRQGDEGVGRAHQRRRARGERAVREPALVAPAAHETQEQQRQEQLARAVLPEGLTAHAPAAGAERVDRGEAERPARRDDVGEGPEQAQHGQRHHEGRGQLLQSGGPGIDGHAGEHGPRVDGDGDDRGRGRVGGSVVAAAVVQEIRNAVKHREHPAGGLVVQERELVEVRVALAKHAERQVSRRQGVARAERASIGDVHEDHGQKEQPGGHSRPDYNHDPRGRTWS